MYGKRYRLKNDGFITISTGRSRKESIWQNKEMKWSSFLNRVSKTKRTKETYEEYKKLPKSQQDNIKDVGGFVGGKLKDGKRRRDSVLERSLLTLDVDFGEEGLWEIIEMLFDFACVMYTTHKHSKSKPRFRLVIPLKRPVSPEEYEAVGRKVCEDIGIDYFDDTTYEASRLMYWPSTSKNGKFVFKYIDSVWLDPDEILDRYDNWRDSTSWSVSSRDIKKREILKNTQQNPREKKGIVGAFCRTYSVVDVIEKFLKDVYEPCDDYIRNFNSKSLYKTYKGRDKTVGCLPDDIIETGTNINSTIPSRYTYKKGSTYGGLVIYKNGDFAYSHHSTDPAGGRLCNSFDLVRYHKFKYLDEKENKKDINKKGEILKKDIDDYKLPSYKAMVDFAIKDEDVKMALGKERLESAKREFIDVEYKENENEEYKEKLDIKYKENENIEYEKEEDVNYRENENAEYKENANYKDELEMDKEIESQKVEAETPANIAEKATNNHQNIEDKNIKSKNAKGKTSLKINAKWTKLLEVNSKGMYKTTIGNILLILQNDPYLKDKIALNEFSHKTVIKGDLPWHKLQNKSEGDAFKDSDDAGLRYYIEEIYSIVSPSKINDALLIVEEKNKYHPIRDYFRDLNWDGKARLDTLFIDYLGAENNLYTKAVTRKSLVAAVARVFKPGIKFDYMLVLVGKQGIGKSHIIGLLGGNWYSDSLNTVQGKEAYEQLQDAWIIEMAELSATKKAETEAVKHFISKREDIYRVAYGKRVTKFPRQCVFFGTTNDNDFLRDRTGNRRYWPVVLGVNKRTKNLWQDMNKYEIDQIWAEAFKIYKDGESLFLTENLEKEAVKVQEKHTEISSKEGLIREYLNKLLPEDWYKLDISDRRMFIHGNDFGETKEGTLKREKVCAMEIWVELFNGDAKQMTPYQAREINDILRRIKGWKAHTKGTGKLRFGNVYGYQRAFVREK